MISSRSNVGLRPWRSAYGNSRNEKQKAVLDVLDQVVGCLGGVREVRGVPGGDLFGPTRKGPVERAQMTALSRALLGGEAPVALACGGLVAVSREFADDLLGIPGGPPLCVDICDSHESEAHRVGVFEPAVGHGDKAPDRIRSPSPLRLRHLKVSFWTRRWHSSSLPLAWRTT